MKISRNYKNKILQQPYAGLEYSPGASSTLMHIVPFLASLYTVFHSVIYNSVTLPFYITLARTTVSRQNSLLC